MAMFTVPKHSLFLAESSHIANIESHTHIDNTLSLRTSSYRQARLMSPLMTGALDLYTRDYR